MRHVATPVPPVSPPAVAPDAQRRVGIAPHSTSPPIVDAPDVRKITAKVVEPEPRKK
jgi:hypothetical protein